MFQPQITFTIEINRNLGRINLIRELINLVPIIPHWEAEIQRTALVNTVHYSTKIEGNTLNLEDVEKLLSGRKAKGSEKDKQEVTNLQRVMEFVNDVAMNRDTVLSENLIKQFNSYILRDIPGILVRPHSSQPMLAQSLHDELRELPVAIPELHH